VSIAKEGTSLRKHRVKKKDGQAQSLPVQKKKKNEEPQSRRDSLVTGTGEADRAVASCQTLLFLLARITCEGVYRRARRLLFQTGLEVRLFKYHLGQIR
jgi:hypothetical protein